MSTKIWLQGSKLGTFSFLGIFFKYKITKQFPTMKLILIALTTYSYRSTCLKKVLLQFTWFWENNITWNWKFLIYRNNRFWYGCWVNGYFLLRCWNLLLLSPLRMFCTFSISHFGLLMNSWNYDIPTWMQQSDCV